MKAFLHFLCLDSKEARNYVAGYICKKLSLIPHETLSLKPNSWISWKGEGKLIEPNSELVELIAKCDNLFDKFHGKGIRVMKNPLEKLCEKIQSENPDFPTEIVKLFCKVKFFSRIKDLNNQLKLSRKKSVRCFKQLGQFLN